MPVMDFAGLSQFAGLVVNQARIVVVDPPSDTLYNQIVPFSVDARQISLDLQVNISGTRQLEVSFELLSGTQVIFTGTQTVTATAGATTPPDPTPIVPTFVGPGTNIGSLLIGPRDTTVLVNATVPFSVSARDSSNNPVAQFYASWTTSSTVHTINAAGEFQAGSTADAVWIHAKTPTGIKDSTQIFVQAAPTTASITMSLPGNLIGVGGTGQLTVTLSQPAPAGGVTVTVTSDSTAYVTVAAPGTIAFLAGQTSRTITLNGIALGASIIRATAPGYIAGIFGVVAAPPVIVLTNAASVAVGGTTPVAIQMVPAPTSATTVTLATADSSILTVTPTSVNFAAGQAIGNSTIQGVGAGTSGVTATAAGYLPGASPITVTSTAATPTTLQKQAGDNQTAFINDTTAIRLQARVLDQGGAPMPGISVLFSVGANGGTIGGTTNVGATTNAAGIAVATAWRMGATPATYTIIASIPASPAVAPVTFSATATLPPPVIQLAIFGSTVVGQARSGQLDVTLLQAAPAGGLTVTLTSTRTGLLRIGTYTSENGSAVFTQGQTVQSVTVFGDSLVTGIDTVIATAPGYTPDTLAVPVSVNLISLPGTLNVPLNTSVSLGITISTPAPAGGLQVAVASSDPATVTVQTPTVTIPQGATTGSATVVGSALGSATVTATNPNYAPFQSTVNVTASLNITSTIVQLNASFGFPILVQLETGAPPAPVAAPAGGVAVTFTSRNPSCAVMTTSPQTIPGGLVSFGDTVVYGGQATLPCSTYIVAAGPAGFAIDSVRADVAVQPVINISTLNIGSGLMNNISGSLGASNHGGTTVHLVSANPAVLLLSPNAATAGTAFIDLPMTSGATSFSYFVHGVEGRIADTVLVTVSAPGFINDTASVRVWQPVIDMVNVPTTSTTFDNNRAVYVRVWTPSSPTGSISSNDQIRTGGTPIIATIALSDSTVARLVQQVQGRADTATVTIPVGGFNSPTTLASGGAEFDVVAGGTVVTSATAPGTRSVTSALGVTTVVSSPIINMPTSNIGSGLMNNFSGSLSASGHGGTSVHLVSTDSSRVLLSLNATTAGTGSIDIPVGVGGSTFSYYVHGVEGLIADTVTILATAPGFTGGSGAVRVWQAVIDMVNVPTALTSLDANRAFYVRTWTPSSPTGGISSNDQIRFGGVSITVRIGLTDSTVARLTQQTPGRADSATVTILPSQFNSPTTLAAGGVEFDVLAAGTVVTSASSPVARSVGTALGVTTTVTAPNITVSTMNIGSGLQNNTSGSVGTTGHPGVTVHLVVSDSSKALVSPNVSTPGTGSIDIIVPAGAGSFSYYVQGVEGLTADTVTLTATAPSFNTGTSQIRVWQPVYIMQSLSTTATSLDANRVFYASVWTPSNPTTGGINSNDQIRAGGVAQTVTFATTQATVAQLTTQTQTGSQVTASIGVLQFNTPTTFAAGAVAIDYLTTGTTVVTADVPAWRALAADTVTVTVVAPAITVSAPTVGSGLMDNGSASLTVGVPTADSVTISSSNPSVALVSPNATTAGAASIRLPMGAGAQSVSYFVHGIEGQVGQVTIRVQVPGYTDGTGTASIVAPALDLSSVLTTGQAGVTADDMIFARLGVPNSPVNTGLTVLQQARAGGPGITVTLQSTNAAAGALVTTATTGSPVTITVAPGQQQSPSSVALGGVALRFLTAGSTTISATSPGFVVLPTASANVTINP